jgi:predicted GIY-YIG superfamily endonuclease
MGNYVYQYLHPEYGHLYCGRTSNLDKRIYEHNNRKSDNIPRKYEKLLKESIIMYIELNNKAQEISAEAYCIDKYKPYLNKSLKCNNTDSVLEMKLPKWKIYDEEKFRYNEQLSMIREEKARITKSISNINDNIKTKKDELSKIKFKLEKIDYEIKNRNDAKNIKENVLFGFELDDIKWFYKHCENKNVKFYSELYDKTGNMPASGFVYYNINNGMLTLVKFGEDNSSITMTEEQWAFDIMANSLYKFYPDINIYPELYAALLSKKDELSITNAEYDLKELMEKYNNDCVDSVDRSIRVTFENGEINECYVELDFYSDIYKGKYNLVKNNINNKIKYDWSKWDGLRFIDKDDTTFKKEKIDAGVEGYIFSCKYHHPNRNEPEEDYCNKMLSKYK